MSKCDLKKSAYKGEVLHVWDAEGSPPVGDWTIVLWRQYASIQNPAAISIPEIVEQHADELRASYLAWIHDFGEALIDGKKVIDQLTLRAGFSYWCMTSMAQKANFYEPHIVDAVKCLALEKLFEGTKLPEKIVLFTTNAGLVKVFAQFCSDCQIKFACQPAVGQHPVTSFLGGLLLPVMALLVLCRMTIRGLWDFSSVDRAWPRRVTSTVAVFDILVHLQQSALSGGRFGSHYWTQLVGQLEKVEGAVTWVHTYFRHADVSSLKRANKLMSQFNGASGGAELHGLIDSQISWKGVGRSLFSYLRLLAAFLRIRVKSNFMPTGSRLNFWHLFKQSWCESLIGPAAMRNCMMLSMFECALTRMPHQRMGLYIQENQPWEMALLHVWRAAGHGQIIGVPHTTIRFWDLRYFFDSRIVADRGPNSLPRPDIVALNGPLAIKAYLDFGYPESELIAVEALRYLHLLERHSGVRTACRREAPLVVICGDNIPGANTRLMKKVVEAQALLSIRPRFIFKPHKAAAFDLGPYKLIDITLASKDLPTLLAECDVVITGGSTTAAVDAYYMGIRVLVMADGSMLNMCPLRDLAGMILFEDARSLAEALRGCVESESNSKMPVQLFYLDANLPRWRLLLQGSHEERV